MNVYQKLAQARLKLKNAGLKQSGKNKGVGYTYFDLQDILPQTTMIEKELGLLSVVTFSNTEGTLTVINTEQPEEKIIFSSPLREAELRGCHPVQNLGAIETYVRRYLYLLAYEIVETEALDLTQGSGDKTQNKVQEGRKAQPPAERKNALQNANDEVTEDTAVKQKTRLQQVREIIKGTAFTIDDVNSFIESKCGEPKSIDDITESQFNYVLKSIKHSLSLSQA